MAEHIATISWKNTGGDFLRGKYSREHTWTFDGGATIAASPAPSVVPAPWSNPALIDPEEAFVASLSSCHMLTYLFIAARKGFLVESYEDHAVGTMGKNAMGRSLDCEGHARSGGRHTARRSRPPRRGRDAPSRHEQCFISNSVTTEWKSRVIDRRSGEAF